MRRDDGAFGGCWAAEHHHDQPQAESGADRIRTASTDIAARHLADTIPDGPWQNWAARLVPTVVLEAVIAWLDAGQPDPDQAAERISQVVHGIVQAVAPH